MSGDVVTYLTDDDGDGPSWVIADGGGWCPGAFTTDDAARYAHRMGYDRMLAFWQQWQAEHPEVPTPSASIDDVRGWRQQTTGAAP